MSEQKKDIVEPIDVSGDARTADQTSPHTAYCDIAIQDALVEAIDNGAGAWDLNPWVCVVSFRPELRNIDHG